MKEQLHKLIVHYWPFVLACLVAVWNWVKKDLALAISQADKNNDGRFDNDELEDLAVILVRNSPNIFISTLPDFIIRALVRYLCSTRCRLYGRTTGIINQTFED